tara:strand:- start:465 stop:1007 length:543 start_codon:yes stop_codon:yes gene_type:complete
VPFVIIGYTDITLVILEGQKYQLCEKIPFGLRMLSQGHKVTILEPIESPIIVHVDINVITTVKKVSAKRVRCGVFKGELDPDCRFRGGGKRGIIRFPTVGFQDFFKGFIPAAPQSLYFRMAHKIHWGRKGIGPDLGGKGTQPHKEKNNDRSSFFHFSMFEIASTQKTRLLGSLILPQYIK